MNKEELKEEVGKLDLVETEFEADGLCYMDGGVSLTQVYDLIDRLDEPDKVVLPDFVAEAFENVKNDNAYAEQLISKMYEYSDEVGYWLEVPSNEKLLLRAWLDGCYEIEKEKLYVVKLIDNHLTYYLAYDLVNKVFFMSQNQKEKLNKFKKRFTEQEIKDHDERFWQFAGEVADGKQRWD